MYKKITCNRISICYNAKVKELLNQGGFSMYVISSDCIACGACSDTCPAGAISMGDEHYEINQDACLSCGACIDTCPTGAIAEK